MPEPITWLLLYPTRTEDEELVYRHHSTSLQHDPHVEGVSYCDFPDAVELLVVFRAGFNQPATPELHALNLRYRKVEPESLFQRILRDDLF